MSGNAPGAVPPADPAEAQEADKAKPGSMHRESGAGRDSGGQGRAHKPPAGQNEREEKISWIEIEMVDEEGKPVPGMPYRITLPDGATVAGGTTDENGFARVDFIEPGNCKVTFPTLDQEAWEEI